MKVPYTTSLATALNADPQSGVMPQSYSIVILRLSSALSVRTRIRELVDLMTRTIDTMREARANDPESAKRATAHIPGCFARASPPSLTRGLTLAR